MRNEAIYSGLEVRLEEIFYGARNINLYRFRSANGAPLPLAEPGAHIDLHISEDFVRSYSLIAGGSASDSYVIGVLSNDNGRGGSRAWHSGSLVGKSYRISPPRNNFPLVEGEHETFLLAGGIGITPLIGMHRHLLRTGRKTRLFYWAREPEDFLFSDELKSDHAVHQFATDLPGSTWPAVSSVVAKLPRDSHVYCCGPNSMLSEFLSATQEWPVTHVHTERFAGEIVPENTTSFTVRLAKSDCELVVGPGHTILSACLAAGIDVPIPAKRGYAAPAKRRCYRVRFAI